MVFVFEEELPCDWVDSIVWDDPGYPGGFDPFIRVGGDSAWSSDDGDSSYVAAGPNPPNQDRAACTFPPATPFDPDDETKRFRLRVIGRSSDGSAISLLAGPGLEHQWGGGVGYPLEPDYAEVVGPLNSDNPPLLRAEVLLGLGASGTADTLTHGCVVQNETNGATNRVTYIGLQVGYEDGTEEPPEDEETDSSMSTPRQTFQRGR